MFFMRIIFVAVISTIVITFLFKINEDRDKKRLWKLEKEFESMDVELTKIKNRISNISQQFKKAKSRKTIPQTGDEFARRAFEINAPRSRLNRGTKPPTEKEHKQEYGGTWIFENHPLNRVKEVLEKEQENLEQKMDEKKNQIIDEKTTLYNKNKESKNSIKYDITSERKKIDEISKKKTLSEAKEINIETDRSTVDSLLLYINNKLEKKEHPDDVKIRLSKAGPEAVNHIMWYITKIDEYVKEEFQKIGISIEDNDIINKLENVDKERKADLVKLVNLKTYLIKLNEKIVKDQTRIAEEFDIPDELKGKKKKSDQLLIFAALFAIIGGLAITSALESFTDPVQNTYIPYAHNIFGFLDLISSKPAFVIASFLPIAILFIHCGIIFLSTDAVRYISQGNKITYFISSLIIFIEGIILFYASTEINDILNFSFWIFVLMAIDLVWLGVNWIKGLDFEPQWINFDLSMLFFTLCVLLLFRSVTQIETEVYAYMVVVFVGRTCADYIAGWRTFWSRFDVSESVL